METHQFLNHSFLLSWKKSGITCFSCLNSLSSLCRYSQAESEVLHTFLQQQQYSKQMSEPHHLIWIIFFPLLFSLNYKSKTLNKYMFSVSSSAGLQKAYNSKFTQRPMKIMSKPTAEWELCQIPMNVDFASRHEAPTWHGHNVFSVHALASKHKREQHLRKHVFGGNVQYDWAL